MSLKYSFAGESYNLNIENKKCKQNAMENYSIYLEDFIKIYKYFNYENKKNNYELNELYQLLSDNSNLGNNDYEVKNMFNILILEKISNMYFKKINFNSFKLGISFLDDSDYSEKKISFTINKYQFYDNKKHYLNGKHCLYLKFTNKPHFSFNKHNGKRKYKFFHNNNIFEGKLNFDYFENYVKSNLKNYLRITAIYLPLNLSLINNLENSHENYDLFDYLNYYIINETKKLLIDHDTINDILNKMKNHYKINNLNIEENIFPNIQPNTEPNIQQNIQPNTQPNTQPNSNIEPSENKLQNLTLKDIDIPYEQKQCSINSRPYQSKLRYNAFINFNGQCIISGRTEKRLLEACHIKPDCDCEPHEKIDNDNILLLWCDIHIYFDLYEVSINPDTESFIINPNSECYEYFKSLGFENKKIMNLSEKNKFYLKNHFEKFNQKN